MGVVACFTSNVIMTGPQVAQLWTDFQALKDLSAAIVPGAQSIWSVKQSAKLAPANWEDIVNGAIVAKTGTAQTVTSVASPTFGT
jgi:hypothetical protein